MAVGDAIASGYHQTLTQSDISGTWTHEASLDTSASYNNVLTAVSCPSTSVCVAVGYTGDSSGDNQPLAESWNGTAWALVTEPATTATSKYSLHSVSCVSATSCFAVGSLSTSSTPLTPLGESFAYSAGAWSAALMTPNDPTSTAPASLQAISCVSGPSCMAVGYDTSSSTDVAGPLTETTNGSTWTTEAAVVEGANSNAFNAVSCTSTSYCMAVGEEYGGSYWDTLAEEWNGSTWSDLSIPNGTSVASNVLTGVSCVPPNFCQAAGFYGYNNTSLTYSTYAAHASFYSDPLLVDWTGASWTQTTAPAEGTTTGNQLMAVSCPVNSVCTAVGAYNSVGTSGGTEITPTLNPVKPGELATAITNQDPTFSAPTNDFTALSPGTAYNAVAYKVDKGLAPTTTGWTSTNGSPMTSLEALFTPSSATTPIAYVTQSQTSTNPTGTSTAFTLASAPLVGDTLILSYGIGDCAGVISSVTGGGVTWAKAIAYNDYSDGCADGDTEIWYGLASTGTSSTVTLTYTASLSGCTCDGFNITEWSGVGGFDSAQASYDVYNTINQTLVDQQPSELNITAPAPTIDFANLTAGSSNNQQPMGTVNFTNTVGDGMPWSTSVAATDLVDSTSHAIIPFTDVTVLPGSSMTTISGGYLPSSGSTVTLSGTDGSPGVSFSNAVTLASGLSNYQGSYQQAGGKMEVNVPANVINSSFTGTLQYTITG